MKFFIFTILFALSVLADTPPPGVVGLKGNPDGNAIGSTLSGGFYGLNTYCLNCSGGGGGGGTVTQGPGGLSPWLFNLGQVGGSSITLGQKTLANGIPVSIASDQILPVSQSGSWTVGVNNFPSSFGRTWTLNSGTDSVQSFQGGTWNVGITGTPSVNATIVGTANVSASQSGTWTVQQGGAPWSFTLSGSIPAGANTIGAISNTTFASTQSGTWSVGLSAGANNIGSVNQGTSPWVVSGTVTANLGTLNGAATAANQTSVQSAPGTPASTAITIQGNASGVPIPIQDQPDVTPATQAITTLDTVTTSTTYANNQKYYIGTPTAGSTAQFAVTSYSSIFVQVTGTWTGTLQTESSSDGGVTWFTAGVKQRGTAYETSSFTNNFAGDLNMAAMTNFRVRATSAMTGSATVLITKSVNTNAVHVTSIVKSADTQGSGSITAGGQTISIPTNGAGTAMITITGTWSATVQFQGGISLGATSGVVISSRAVGGNDSNSISANGTYCVDTAGFSSILVTTSAFTSGTISVSYNVGSGTNKACGNASAEVSLGNNNKSTVMKTGNISTTAVTANQVIVTYTVTAGKTFFLQYWDCTGNTEAAAVTAAAFGTCSLSINGTIVWTQYLHGAGQNSIATQHDTAEAFPVQAGQVILLETTPAAATAFFWYANFGGYER